MSIVGLYSGGIGDFTPVSFGLGWGLDHVTRDVVIEFDLEICRTFLADLEIDREFTADLIIDTETLFNLAIALTFARDLEIDREINTDLEV